MADFSIQLTVPDEKVTELVDALNWSWNDGEVPDVPLTGAEIKTELKSRIEMDLQRRFKTYKNHLRYIAATNLDSDQLGIT